MALWASGVQISPPAPPISVTCRIRDIFLPQVQECSQRGEKIIEIVAFVVGLLIGLLLCYVYLRGRLSMQLERWKTEFGDQLRREVLDRSRTALKGRIGEQLAPLLPMFKHEPSDARFIGTPIDYVVFEGLAEHDPREIVFIDVKTGKTTALTPTQQKIKQTIEQKRVRWETIHIGALDEQTI